MLKFRCRSDQKKWYRTLKRQTATRAPSIGEKTPTIEFTPNKRRQIYFIDGTNEFEQQTVDIQNNFDVALKKRLNFEETNPKNPIKSRFAKTMHSISANFMT